MKRRTFLKGAGTAMAAAAMPLPGFAQAKVATRPVPATGELLPIVGFGNSQHFRNNDYENAKPLLDVLMERGGRFVDTGLTSMAVHGRYMRENAADDALFLGTNISVSSADAAREEVDEAKRLQGKETLDLLQLYRPEDLGQNWRIMQALKDEGHARYIGIAFTGEQFFELAAKLLRDLQPDFIQLNYSMLEPEAGNLLLPLAEDNGVAVVTNRPFVNGRYFPMVQGKQLPEWAADFDCASWAQFSLKWILADPRVTCTLTETTKTRHALDNLAAGVGRLPDDATRARMRAFLRSRYVPRYGYLT